MVERQHLVLMGVSGSGKSTVAERLVARLGWPFAEGDDLHPEANVAKMAAGEALTDEDRRPWLARIRAWVTEREDAGESSVVTCSALKRAYRDVLRDGPGRVRFVHLTVPADQLASRMQTREGHFMPASLLESQLATLEPLGPDEDAVEVEETGDPEEVVTTTVRLLGLEG